MLIVHYGMGAFAVVAAALWGIGTLTGGPIFFGIDVRLLLAAIIATWAAVAMIGTIVTCPKEGRMFAVHFALGVLVVVAISILGIGALAGNYKILGIHVGWMLPTVLVTWATVAVVEAIATRPAALVWLRANPLLVIAGGLVVLAIACFVLGWNTAGWVLLAIALVLFLRHSCRWWNWCARLGAWWVATGWPWVKRKARDAFALFSRKMAELSAWTRAEVLPWIQNDVAPWLKDHALILAWAGSAALAYFVLYDAKATPTGEDAPWYGMFSGQTWWFWVTFWIAIGGFLAWSTASQEALGALIRAIGTGIGDGIAKAITALGEHLSDIWNATTGARQLSWVAITALVIGWLGYLGHSYWERSTSLRSFWRIMEGNNYFYVVGGLALGVVIAFYSICRPRARPAAPAAPAAPAPAAPLDRAARLAAAEREARRAARQARVDFLRRNP